MGTTRAFNPAILARCNRLCCCPTYQSALSINIARLPSVVTAKVDANSYTPSPTRERLYPICSSVLRHFFCGFSSLDWSSDYNLDSQFSKPLRLSLTTIIDIIKWCSFIITEV